MNISFNAGDSIAAQPRVTGLSITGASHRQSRRCCEDWSGWFSTSDCVVIAVADGAGSAPLASIGSAIAVHAALLTLLDAWQTVGNFTPDCSGVSLRAAVRSAFEALSAEAAHRNRPVSDFATTLIASIVARDFAAAVHIGDGAVVVSPRIGKLFTLCAPVQGEYANETRLLGCDNHADAVIAIAAAVDPTSVAVLTDGLQRMALALPSGNPHDRFFRPLFEYVAGHTEPEARFAIEELLKSPRVASRTNDDLTLVVAHLP